MSAFQVSDAHINALVTLAELHRCLGDLDQTETGRRLIRENMLSLASRYGDAVNEEEIAAYVFRRSHKIPTVVEALKIVRCYEYQACEHGGWSESWAAKFCEGLRHTLIAALAGYDRAPWEWNAA